MPKHTPNEHTETGDVAMMRDANRWPCWPLLPLQHATREVIL